ncbi:SAM-dependent methyltransferase [Duganella callida]|uniref:Methyltransferase domain-containing protein n=1 Tax=Duganella callida TaxID=2561932 RepID=A0A4Y9SEH4_9BURK|nr:SAM-dependent methyltransferase [Duganella callida]TFW19377.1 methyltransferase domain-containing protein [Duganella callida]
MNPHATHFQQLYQRDDDPWQVRRRWYEQRKRQLLLASLPAQRYRHVYEPACGNGELTAALAVRAERVTASDVSPTAVKLTRERLARKPGGHAQVSVHCQRVPQDWPLDARFDLIVISEMAYYLSRVDLAQLRDCCINTLTADGVLVLCHWRHPFNDRMLDTTAVHATFDASGSLFRLARHDENDFLLDVWSRSSRSVAQREGLAP